jgi:hypothetical protein
MKPKQILAMLFVAIVLTTACQTIGITDDPKVLTRPKAAAMIKPSSALLKTVNIYFVAQPHNQQILVARHFGYIEPDKLALTEKGKQLWRDLNLQVLDIVVPAAHAELLEVTGISTSGNSASAKFTWHWIPNDIGKALVIDSPEFKALPEDLQAKIRQPIPAATAAFMGSNAGISFGGVRTGIANFQLYDDGWRARDVYTF